MILAFPDPVVEPRFVAKERANGWIVLDRTYGVVTICPDQARAREMALEKMIEDGFERLLKVIFEPRPASFPATELYAGGTH